MKTCNLAYYRNRGNPQSDSFDFHSHTEFEIFMFHSGNCNYLINNTVYYLQPGDMILMNGLTLHRANPLPPEPYERSVIHFSAETIQSDLEVLDFPELLSPFNTFNNCLFRDIPSDLLSRIEKLIEQIAGLYEESKETSMSHDMTLNSRFQEAKMQTLVIQLLFEIFELSQTHLNKLIQVESEKAQHVRRIIVWIEQHYHENVTLDSIAKTLNISKYYMSHIFKEMTGGTIIKYLMGCRINRAKRLLQTEPKKSISEVGLEAGFKHTSHFSRIFLEKTGMNPSDYRIKYCKTQQSSSSGDHALYVNQ
ncbi:AraC family transcriptional regulator [uncultured Metabacillus sp.]|uniref:helix-turn-helix transcriptional regulator n=1 Tax=uncultured Metabacillus sp. TaxID=2860135 RepID=UPI00261D28E0|nr:AraC family transcriptional regulator [uncultured Metabacillus sp.]